MEERTLIEDEIPVKEYEATFEQVMPGDVKPRPYKIHVQAADPVEAMARAKDAWREATSPTDIRIKEIKSKESKV